MIGLVLQTRTHAKTDCPYCGSLYSRVISEGSKRGHRDEARRCFIRWRQCQDCKQAYPTSETPLGPNFYNI